MFGEPEDDGQTMVSARELRFHFGSAPPILIRVALPTRSGRMPFLRGTRTDEPDARFSLAGLAVIEVCSPFVVRESRPTWLVPE
ncbi:MAG TPA: hypothetical protein VJT49_32670 [Amycolatopsis sp.]|uniref:hypothetical protein n=1 Tax=Amycolatopsis sp. TaxID=37632 RepID=UPI002B4843FD|nr:hypothetical protein [Amycolatopsis sp.]HKS49778.1 hypothetical protein [Amycolatopsis sp.]